MKKTKGTITLKKLSQSAIEKKRTSRRGQNHGTESIYRCTSTHRECREVRLKKNHEAHRGCLDFSVPTRISEVLVVTNSQPKVLVTLLSFCWPFLGLRSRFGEQNHITSKTLAPKTGLRARTSQAASSSSMFHRP